MSQRTSDVWKDGGDRRRAVPRTLLCLAWLLLAGTAPAGAHGVVTGPPFDFRADTFDFANQTVYLYPNGYAEKRVLKPGEKPPAFTLHCFTMSRAAEQFRNFARFDPSLPPPDDDTLTQLVRRVTRHAPWRNALPPAQRVIIPGYPDLRTLSHSRPLIVQKNIGQGWTAYARLGNWRMFAYLFNDGSQQARTQQRIEDALRRNDVFIGYLTDFPGLAINHAVAIYGRRPDTPADRSAGIIHYLVYDPNHPDAPRDMAFDTRKRVFSYQKDWDFVGGKLTVLQVYNYPMQ